MQANTKIKFTCLHMEPLNGLTFKQQAITLANTLKQCETHLKHIPVFSITFLEVKLTKNVTILVQVLADVHL